MSALTVVEPAPPDDPLTARLDDFILELGSYVSDSSPARDGVRIDRIARLEKLRASTAALQASETVRFARSQVAEQLAQDVHPDAIGRGIGDPIALACKISPSAGWHRLAVARALWFELPETLTQLTAGELIEQVARVCGPGDAPPRRLDPTPWPSSRLPSGGAGRRLLRLTQEAPTPLSPAATPAPATRSWPTPSSNG